MADVENRQLFPSEYRQELEVWLRRRFRFLCATYLVLGVLALLEVALTGLLVSVESPGTMFIETGARLANLLVIGYFFRRDWSAADRDQILRAATRMILVVGTVSLVAVFASNMIREGGATNSILPLFLWHFSACLFLPWTPRESLRPFAPLFIVWAALALLFPRGSDWAWPIVSVIFGPGVFIPGLGICAWRLRSHSRSFRSRMVGQHFVTMRREFSRARQIHESMFPAPYDDGFVRFEYTYSPMRELGGDYVHLHIGAAGLVHLTLLDVTGHGLAAALTVNRLHGELERIRGELPRAQPGDVLSLLNRYVHLTMARHNIYATAACCTIDPYLGQLHWASAGHPPAYLRGANGVITDLNATTVPLGAVEGDQFDPDQQDIELAPGDTLVLCTDGVFESRDRIGQQFGLDRLRDLMTLQPPPRNWPSFVASAVGRHNGGHNEDDVLIASLKYLQARAHETSEAEEALAAT